VASKEIESEIFFSCLEWRKIMVGYVTELDVNKSHPNTKKGE